MQRGKKQSGHRMTRRLIYAHTTRIRYNACIFSYFIIFIVTSTYLLFDIIPNGNSSYWIISQIKEMKNARKTNMQPPTHELEMLESAHSRSLTDRSRNQWRGASSLLRKEFCSDQVGYRRRTA